MKEYNEKVIREEYTSLTRTLIQKGLTITSMESATSGQIASLITDTEGSSAIFKGAFITYSNEAKIRMGVPAEIIEKYTVYSKETAAAMAELCRREFQADIGIGVTGTMGNVDPANEEASEPGKVFFAISTQDGTESCDIEIPLQPSRLMYKLAAADEIYRVLIEGVLK
ncbi:MAG: CinA family protein [Lachnospiraceae bacterium]|nr:CinA family protein [Lachnospiraceae bacterium]